VPHGAALADPTPAELAALRQLFVDAKELETKGEWAAALEKFRKVGEVKMTPQVRFHIALSEEHTGKLVAAINDFERAEQEAKQAANAPDVAENAPVRAAALRKRVPHVRITVTGTIERSKILLDGAPVAAALVGTDLPVDIGKHVIEVSRDGETIARRELELAESASESVPLEVDDASAPLPKPPEPEHVAPAPLPPPPKPLPPPHSRIPMYAAAGVGVAGLVGAGVFLGLRESTIVEIRDTCPDDRHCDPDLQSSADNGRTYTVLAGVLAGVGVVGLGTAGVLWLTERKPSGPHVTVAPTAGGLRVLGAF
jgi:hypothetical protein